MKYNLGIRVHSTNKKFVEAAACLHDENGKGLINGTAAAILEAIGKFEYSKGNFMSDEVFAKNLMGTKKMSMKTLRSYIKYLHYLGVISIRFEEGLPVRRLAFPTSEQKKCLRDFRCYTYMKEQNMNNNQNSPEEEDDFSSFFISKSEENFSKTSGKFFPEHGENFSRLTNKEEREYKLNENLKEDLHHKGLLLGADTFDSVEGLEQLEETAKVTQDEGWDFESYKDTEEMSLKSKDSKSGGTPAARMPANPVSFALDEEIRPEPLIDGGKKKKTPRTAQERRAVAAQEYNKGHLCNPVGKPNTKGRRLKPNKARPVADVGSVTLSQLWGEYLKIFEQNFGDRDILLNLMSDTKERVEVFFSDLKQKFLDSTGRTIDNRQLLEYIKWYHDPIRMKPILVGSKKAFIHPNQLGGLVYIQRFVSERLGSTTKITSFVSSKVETEQKKTTFMSSAFEDMRSCESDTTEFAKCIAKYGYVVFAEYMADLHGMNASQCKQKIIDLMYAYIKTSPDRKRALKYMEQAWERTLANADIECYIWPDWKETSKDLLKVVLEKLDKENINDVSSKGQEEG